MELYYFRGANVGDLLNPWLWPRYLGDLDKISTHYKFCGIGTLLNDKLPRGPKIVFGSGVGYGKGPAVLDETVTFFVRGPLSAQSLGMGPEAALCDPGILVAEHYTPPRAKTWDLGYMPHHEVADDPWVRGLCEAAKIHFLDPRQDVDTVLAEMGGCERIVTEAMHGAIIADALRIPWMPVSFHYTVNEFKWRDYCTSVNLEYRPFFYSRTMGYCCTVFERGICRNLCLSLGAAAFRKAVASRTFDLTADSVLESANQRIHAKIGELKQFLGQ